MIAAFTLALAGCRYFNDTFGPEKGSGGPKWESFSTANSGLISDDVLSVAVDVSGREWFGLPDGVSMLGGGKWTSFSTGSPIGARQVNAVTIARDGSLWFGTGGAGIFRYSQNDPQKQWISYGVTDGLPDGWIYSIAVNGYGDIWVGTNFGAGRFVESISSPQFSGKWTAYRTDQGLPDDHVTAVASDNENVIWAGTSNSGLAEFNGTNWESIPLSNSYRISGITVDRSDVKWISTWNGVFRYDGTSWVHYDTTDGLPAQVANCIAIGPGVVWVGTNLGACMYDGKSWTTFDTQNSPISSNEINAIAVDTYDNVWFGTSGGVSVYNENGVRN